jgi:hypothetical protein
MTVNRQGLVECSGGSISVVARAQRAEKNKRRSAGRWTAAILAQIGCLESQAQRVPYLACDGLVAGSLQQALHRLFIRRCPGQRSGPAVFKGRDGLTDEVRHHGIHDGGAFTNEQPAQLVVVPDTLV